MHKDIINVFFKFPNKNDNSTKYMYTNDFDAFC